MKTGLTSLLIVAKSSQASQETAQQFLPFTLTADNPDAIIIDDQTIGIQQIKQLKLLLQRRPYQESIKVAFFPQAENLTAPAQNALLKTLEEPPANTLIILATANPNLLLPTIVSRCHLINLASQPNLLTSKGTSDTAKLISTITSATTSQKISLTTAYTKSRDEAKDFCQQLLIFFHSKLRTHPTSATLANLKLTQTTLERLKKNVNVSLSLEHLFLGLQ